MKMWNKLVRDRIPEIIEADNLCAVTRTLDAAEFVEALHHKLLEEAMELQTASLRDDVVSEAADVLEVLSTICGAHGISLDEVARRQEGKRIERGGFAKRTLLIETRPVTT